MIYPTNNNEWSVREDKIVAAKNLPRTCKSRAKTAEKQLKRFQHEPGNWFDDFPKDGVTQPYEKGEVETIALHQERLKELYWLTRATDNESVTIKVPHRCENSPLYMRMGETELIVGEYRVRNPRQPSFIAEDR